MQFVFRHKIPFFLVLVFLLCGGYFGYHAIHTGKKDIAYNIGIVQRGTITSSISGSGQISALNKVDVKAKVSGDVLSVFVEEGKTVMKGNALIELDNRDAKKAVRDAEVNLKTAKLSLVKLKRPADRLTMLAAEHALAQSRRTLEDLQKPPDALLLLETENTLAQAKESKQKTLDIQKKAYDDGFNSVSNAFLDLPSIISGLQSMLFDTAVARGGVANIDWYLNQVVSWDNDYKAKKYRDDAASSYRIARDVYTKNFEHYKSISRSSDTSAIETLILETYDTTRVVADAVKDSNNYLDYIDDIMQQHSISISSLMTTHQGFLDTYTAKTNTHLSSLLSIKRSIQDSRDALINADRSIIEKSDALAKLKEEPDTNKIQDAQEKIKEKEEGLNKLKEGPDDLDIISQELVIQQRENTLKDLREKLNDYTIQTPFEGVVAAFDLKRGDSVSANSLIATVITKERLAEITMNEVDIAKVKIGQKAILTFDAIPSLSITGQVAQIDVIGTSSQGVVSYTVKIMFDTQDERIKAGMSVSTEIITDVKTNVLMVPNGSLKIQGSSRYVEVPDAQSLPKDPIHQQTGIVFKNSPYRKMVEIGIFNDEFTEIISGLSEGGVVVTSTINRQATPSNQNQQAPAFRVPGLPNGGGRSR